MMFSTPPAVDPHPRTPSRRSGPLSSSTPQVFQTPVNPFPKRTSKTCLPRPLFQDEPPVFSTKKERREGALFCPATPPPAKSCPPKSRVRGHRHFMKAQAVTFNRFNDSGAVTETPLSSTVYDDKKGESYFEQAFIVEKQIGAGCFGTVYKVKCKEDNQTYAVKQAKEMYKGRIDRTLKLEEVRKHEVLPPHSNIVRFYKSWEEGARLYQAFELCQTSLSEQMSKEGRLPEDMVWAYTVDLLQALEHLHEHDLVHMDIKPENIFIGMDGICKLGDFGLMIDLTKGESEVATEGDPCYLAPETMRSQFTKACDVFSLGVTLLELATDLDLPKNGQLWQELRNKGPDPRVTQHLTPEMRRVIQLMMTQDPQRRPGVKQLLELPSVKLAVKRRARQLLLSRVRGFFMWFLMVLNAFLSFLLDLVTSILQPLDQMLDKTALLIRHKLQEASTLSNPSTPHQSFNKSLPYKLQEASPASPTTPHRSFDKSLLKMLNKLREMSTHISPSITTPNKLSSIFMSSMDCFSDDERDNTVSSSGSSLAAPLDSSPSLSQSRTTSTPHRSVQFFSPDVSRDPVTTAEELSDSLNCSPRTTPLRGGPKFKSRTPGLTPGKRLFFGGGDSSDMSPMPRPRRSRYTNTPELVQTPANRGADDHGDSDEDIVLAPKSLAATFDYFSDSD